MKVTQLQLFMLYSLYLFTTLIAFMLSSLIESSRFMTGLAVVLGAVLGFLPVYLSYRLASRRPDRFFTQYGQEIVSKWLHYPLLFLMVLACLTIAISNLRELQDFLIQIYLPDTPAWAVIALCGLCIAYAVRSGINTIFRAAEGIFMLSTLVFLAIPFFVFKEFKPGMAMALLNHFQDIKGLWAGIYYTASIYGEMAFLLFIFPYLNAQAKTIRSLAWVGVTTIIITLSHLIPILLIFGPQLASDLSYPDLELIRFVRTAPFVETLDPILIALWLASLFVKMSFITFIIVHTITQTLKLKDHKPFSFSVTLFTCILSIIMVKSTVEFDHFVRHGALTFLIMGELIPIFYLVVDRIRSPRKIANE